MTLEICTVDELSKITQLLEDLISEHKNIVLLNGDLGSGKTAIAKAYVSGQLNQTADSPTFSIVNTYSGKGKTVHHFDLYRLQSLDEIEDIGFWDYIDAGVPCFIEWPDKIAELLPAEQCIKVDISINLKQCREYTISY